MTDTLAFSCGQWLNYMMAISKCDGQCFGEYFLSLVGSVFCHLKLHLFIAENSYEHFLDFSDAQLCFSRMLIEQNAIFFVIHSRNHCETFLNVRMAYFAKFWEILFHSFGQNISCSELNCGYPQISEEKCCMWAKKSKVFTREKVNKFEFVTDGKFLIINEVISIRIGIAFRINELAKILTFLKLKTQKEIKIRWRRSQPCAFRWKVGYSKAYPCYSLEIVSYSKAKYTVQLNGIHFFSEIPQRIADSFLFNNPKMFTGHCILDLTYMNLVDENRQLEGVLEKVWIKKLPLFVKFESAMFSSVDWALGYRKESKGESLINFHSMYP